MRPGASRRSAVPPGRRGVLGRAVRRPGVVRDADDSGAAPDVDRGKFDGGDNDPESDTNVAPFDQD